MNYPIIHVHMTKEFKVMFISDAAKTKDMPLAAKLNRICSIKEKMIFFFTPDLVASSSPRIDMIHSGVTWLAEN